MGKLLKALGAVALGAIIFHLGAEHGRREQIVRHRIQATYADAERSFEHGGNGRSLVGRDHRDDFEEDRRFDASSEEFGFGDWSRGGDDEDRDFEQFHHWRHHPHHHRRRHGCKKGIQKGQSSEESTPAEFFERGDLAAVSGLAPSGAALFDEPVLPTQGERGQESQEKKKLWHEEVDDEQDVRTGVRKDEKQIDQGRRSTRQGQGQDVDEESDRKGHGGQEPEQDDEDERTSRRRRDQDEDEENQSSPSRGWGHDVEQGRKPHGREEQGQDAHGREEQGQDEDAFAGRGFTRRNDESEDFDHEAREGRQGDEFSRNFEREHEQFGGRHGGHHHRRAKFCKVAGAAIGGAVVGGVVVHLVHRRKQKRDAERRVVASSPVVPVVVQGEAQQPNFTYA